MTARLHPVRDRVLAALTAEPRPIEQIARELNLVPGLVLGILRAAEQNIGGPDGPLETRDGWLWVS
ncbi:hypothetical protein DEIPH_ctg011orf0051 [Deinococcus phoenicis]|uniref:DprA winged helix domain-containing protein n=1 Tax=Deinococcus phoenicis TaxID=1476583 RepID=A0A016QSS1_9DEIO|nr:hypothetical protein DEIPH_ctg011orf0051 [Deinococcus phoenicis]